MKPLILKSNSALSNFRINNLVTLFENLNPKFKGIRITADQVFILDFIDKDKKQDLNLIYKLLSTKEIFEEKNGFFITPRKATTSPWSSKATDIIKNCGIRNINRIEKGIYYTLRNKELDIIDHKELDELVKNFYDPMTEGLYQNLDNFFNSPTPESYQTVHILEEGIKVLHEANSKWGLAMSKDEMEYLYKSYMKIKRNPTDVELVMFSQVNSEHCRHKIFNAKWYVDENEAKLSLFDMIRNTYKKSPKDILTAYSDNSSVLIGNKGNWWKTENRLKNKYVKSQTRLDILCKVETHNHPTAISPFPGAATGVGGEIRDEGATGIGGRSKAGLSAFIVSHLNIKSLKQPWETNLLEHPKRLATPLEIMLEGPIGGAAFGNEFGRPQLTGLFRTFEIKHNSKLRGYHKPVMAAGGMGNLKSEHVHKKKIKSASLVIQIGGPAMKIGLGGGAASSIDAGNQSESLDFDSVQRDNPEMQRRCQQVIDACISLGDKNPILSIHDIGAGGLSNGLPELVEDSGGKFYLREIDNQDFSMSPMEIWCNEAQERYVLAISQDNAQRFKEICLRERCPMAIVGEATNDNQLTLEDEYFKNTPINLKMSILLGKTPRIIKNCKNFLAKRNSIDFTKIKIPEAINRVLKFPAVANKSFLIHIADRTVTGTVCRDQLVGPWQIPISDVAVTSTTMESYTGEAMAMGERTPLALLDAPASGRMAIGECLTNILSSYIDSINKVKLSANWMVAAGDNEEDINLFNTVKAVGLDLCPKLGICIPVGKDSMSMRSKWKDSNESEHEQISPLSLIITGFSPVLDVRKTLTPYLKKSDSTLLLIDLGKGENRLGGSSLLQCYNQMGDITPDLDNPKIFKKFFELIQLLNKKDLILSYHDRSDGGLITTLIEMSIAGRKGLEINLDKLLNKKAHKDIILKVLFNEELGSVIEIEEKNITLIANLIKDYGLEEFTHIIGKTNNSSDIEIKLQNNIIYSENTFQLNKSWSQLTHKIQRLRDNPDCADEAYENMLDPKDKGIMIKPTFDENLDITIQKGVNPKIAILREQGINGHNEMAFAFNKAGFDCYDVHMTDLISKKNKLGEFNALAACGGFSYGDVLGAGSGWAKSILFNPEILEQFTSFFRNKNNIALGVCNGCQMISQLKHIIPGAENWPNFIRNRSEQFEARYSNVKILDSVSIFLKGMQGSILPIPVAHGEGQTNFNDIKNLNFCEDKNLIGMQYVDSSENASKRYPTNPNGSINGNTCFSNTDGRVTIMMPHPERCFRSVQMSYNSNTNFKNENGPWMKLFNNARSYFE